MCIRDRHKAIKKFPWLGFRKDGQETHTEKSFERFQNQSGMRVTSKIKRTEGISAKT